MVASKPILWHITWLSYVPSILRYGLVSGRSRSRWEILAARRRSKGKIWLCGSERKRFWQMLFDEGWVREPTPDDVPVWLKVNTSGLAITPDTGEYNGDYWTTNAVPACAITVCRTGFRKICKFSC